MTEKGKTKNEERKANVFADDADRDVIKNDLDSTLIVEAAAGTGKTTELVRRIIRIIETGRIDVDGRPDMRGIVAVTFTEKAAGELKLRLREALEEARRRAAPGSAERERLDNGLARLEEAQISTIHGFCADVLRERPVEACVDPLFTVLTDGQGQRLYDEAFNKWMEAQLADPPEGVRRSLRRPTFSGFGVRAEFDDGPIDRLKRAGWELTDWRDFDTAWTREPFDRRARIDALAAQLADYVQLLSEPANKFDNLFYDSRSARQLHEDLSRTESVAGRDYDRLEAALIELGRNRDFKNARKGSGKFYRSGILREDVWQARENLMVALAAFERDANADLAALLQQELGSCVSEYEDAKKRAGALDFLDLLLKARKLIRDDGDVRRSFQSRFQRIFVDEFQDTDPLQAEILMLLASNDPSVTDWHKVPPVPGKLFIVGDPKQSIYRFRRADVGVYRTVYEMLKGAGARPVTLQTSFRSQPNIQRVINAAFAPVMNGDAKALQAGYVPLQPFRVDAENQPSVVVLPVPKPYGVRRVSNVEIEKSLPDAVGAHIDWLINESGWKVAERPVDGSAKAEPYRDAGPHREAADFTSVGPGFSRANSDVTPSRARGFKPTERERLVPIQARHVCLLFRRFLSFGEDATWPYVQALEARDIPHLLVGGRSFHNRAEIETLRAALAAIEWPDDELSVFAALRGSLFAIGDEELLQYRARFGGFHPFRIPTELAGLKPCATDAGVRAGDATSPIVSALKLLRSLHSTRNRVPVASTISMLLEATRAHVGFALEHGGEQVLANVSHVAELARRYEADGGISFRGFLDELRAQSESGEATEAPILEEGSDGVRLMTVHKAKGLEFPVVVLVDMTAKLHRTTASRYLDANRRLCAVQIAGCSPKDLLDHEQDELRRDAAEGARLAYVAATRARDLLVIPAVGDEEREGWIQALNSAIYPPSETRREQVQAPGCCEFTSKDSVLLRPDGDPANASTVCPGLHMLPGDGSVVWWDPSVLSLGAEPSLGIRKPELIVKDVAPAIVEWGLQTYNVWQQKRESVRNDGSVPSVRPTPAVKYVPGDEGDRGDREKNAIVEIVELPRADARPSGRRFGSLVHAVLASIPLDAGADVVEQLTRSHGRILGSEPEELHAASHVVRTLLGHPLLERALHAVQRNRCRREVPVTFLGPDGALVEGVVDLAFEEGESWTVVDFKTDEQMRGQQAKYEQQLRLYAAAIEQSTGRAASMVLMRL